MNDSMQQALRGLCHIPKVSILSGLDAFISLLSPYWDGHLEENVSEKSSAAGMTVLY